jgi:hypothetical protein
MKNEGLLAETIFSAPCKHDSQYVAFGADIMRVFYIVVKSVYITLLT